MTDSEFIDDLNERTSFLMMFISFMSVDVAKLKCETSGAPGVAVSVSGDDCSRTWGSLDECDVTW